MEGTGRRIIQGIVTAFSWKIKEVTKIFIQDSLWSVRDSKPVLHEFKSNALPLHQSAGYIVDRSQFCEVPQEVRSFLSANYNAPDSSMAEGVMKFPIAL
jgi:hypothetical protein